jgi:hypothetical protein
VARRSYLALVPKPAAEAWAALVTIAKHMGFRTAAEEHNRTYAARISRQPISAPIPCAQASCVNGCQNPRKDGAV